MLSADEVQGYRGKHLSPALNAMFVTELLPPTAETPFLQLSWPCNMWAGGHGPASQRAVHLSPELSLIPSH